MCVASFTGVTVAAIPVGYEEAKSFGVIEGDANGKILAFHEKSPNPPTMQGDPTRCLASMGNYVFDTKTLIDIVTPAGEDDQHTDIGGHIIPALTANGVAHLYDFSTNEVPGQDQREKGYWRDVGTIDSYYDCNMDLLAPVPVFNLYNNEWPVYTLNDSMPPAKISRGAGGEPAYVDGSLLCAGSIVSGAHVERSIISPDVHVQHDAHVTDSILFPGVQVMPGARVNRCIIDKNVVVPAGVRIGFDRADDEQRFTVSERGIVVIPKDTIALTRREITAYLRSGSGGAGSSRRLSAALAQWQAGRSPRVLRTHLYAYACRIYPVPFPCKFWALMISAISPQHEASYPLPVRQASALPSGFLQTRSRPRNPCLRLTLPLAGRVKDFHLQVDAPCRAH